MKQNKKQNYHILSLIGHGAYGQVFKGRRKGTGQFVAIKLIPKKNKEEKDKVMRDEIDILKKLHHQNIVLLLQAFETHNQFVLVTELGQGELFNIIQNDQSLDMPEVESINQCQVKKVAQQLIRALHYIHSNRIIHRDLKPQNVLMTSDGVIKLCDFGFARCMSHKTQLLTSLKGTPLYMAPQVVKQQPYNHTADLWSLGVILYELATGTPPFTASNLISLVEHISRDPIVYPDEVSGSFKDLLKGLLNKDPKKRLGWPQLLHHPFIKESDEECGVRLKQNQVGLQKIEVFSNWKEQYVAQSQLSAAPNNDPLWSSYLKIASEESGAEKLRYDEQFANALMSVLGVGVAQVIRQKQKKMILSSALKTLSKVLILPVKGLKQNSKLKNKAIPQLLLDIINGLLKLDGGKQFAQLISEGVRIVGLMVKHCKGSNRGGVELVYIRSFIPQVSKLIQLSCETEQHLAINLLRTIGILLSQASCDCDIPFYHALIQSKCIPCCKLLLKAFEQNQNVVKMLVQVLSALMHPNNGPIQGFPWLCPKLLSHDFQLFDCLRQEVVLLLQETRYEDAFESVLEDLLGSVSVIRVLLQGARINKVFIQGLLQQRKLIKRIYSMVTQKKELVDNTIILSTTAQLIVLLNKYCRDKKIQSIPYPSFEQIISFKITVEQVKQEPILGYTLLNLLQEGMATDASFSAKVIQHLDINELFLDIALDFLKSNSCRIDQMRKVQGSNYGVHHYGLCDAACLFLHRLSRKKALKSCKEHIGDVIKGLSQKTDLSLRGMISLLILAGDVGGQQFAQESVIKSLVGILQDAHTECILEWSNLSGNVHDRSIQSCLHTIFGNLMRLLLVCLQSAEKKLLKVVYKLHLIQALINFCKHLTLDTLAPVISFISHLLDPSNDKAQDFAEQFVAEGGLSLYSQFELLDSLKQQSGLVEAVNLLSLIARTSKEYYSQIHALKLMELLKKLLIQGDVQLKARVLHLIGNLCRHSNYFYPHIQQLLPSCIALCEDADHNVSKFGCVAIGNAAFHDDSLYVSLRPSIPILVGLLKIPQQKTRSNAAAALSNLARNSPLLDGEFIKTGVNYHLVAIITSDRSVAARKAAVMAVSNLLALPQSRAVLLSLKVGESLEKINSPDPALTKAVWKALEAIKSP